jgi:hypothetical protein
LDWKKNLARDNRPTIDLDLMQNQSTGIEKGEKKKQ